MQQHGAEEEAFPTLDLFEEWKLRCQACLQQVDVAHQKADYDHAAAQAAATRLLLVDRFRTCHIEFAMGGAPSSSAFKQQSKH